MSAIDNKHLIELLQVKKESGVSKKTGLPWEMYKAQCVIKSGDTIEVGVLNLPKHLQQVQPGKYLAEFELGVDFENRVVPLLTKLHVYGEGASKAAPSARPVSSAS